MRPQQTKSFQLKHGLVHEIEIVDLQELFQRANTILSSPVNVEIYVIVLLEQGEESHMVEFKTVRMKFNSIVFFHKHIIQQFAPDKNSTLQGIAILFSESFFVKDKKDFLFLNFNKLFNPNMPVVIRQDAQKMKSFGALVKQLEQELEKPEDYLKRFVLKNLLHNFLYHCQREADSIGVTSYNDLQTDLVMRFYQNLEAGYLKEHHVLHYANQLGVTPKMLNLATTKVLGKTIKQVIDQRIVLEAKRLLANSDISIKEISFYLGFEEATYFVSYFKKHNQCTPLEFRQKFKKE
ncbi:helix-turn-helix domain-containing protein [Myroides sp. LJL110]